MKKIIFIIAFMIIAPLTASLAFATPITKDAANAFYQNCTAQSAEGLSEESKGFMCACTAAQMMDRMTVEDVKNMALQNAKGRQAMNYMIVRVYAPCMSYPAKDHYYNTCMSNPKTKMLGGHTDLLCECLADQISRYLGMNGEKVFEGILARNPNVTDPMAALTSDPQFEKFAQSKLMACVKERR